MARGIRVRHYARQGYRQVGVFVRSDLYEKLIGEAMRRRVTISDIINEALDIYFKRPDGQTLNS